MQCTATRTELNDVLPLRSQFLQEVNRQIRYNACHERGWSDIWSLQADGVAVGYAAVKGKDKHTDRDAIFEFFVLPSFRSAASPLFAALLAAAPGVAFIECQSNAGLLLSMLFEFGQDANAEAILFDDHATTHLVVPGAVFRKRNKADVLFPHEMEPGGDYVLELAGTVVATGGFLLHYNPPFADLYMEVAPSYRQLGLGSFLIQSLKKECYLQGRVPAARCNIRNAASKATLLRAGMGITAFMLTAQLRQS